MYSQKICLKTFEKVVLSFILTVFILITAINMQKNLDLICYVIHSENF